MLQSSSLPSHPAPGSLAARARAILLRHPRAALRAEELLQSLKLEGSSVLPSVEGLLALLAGREGAGLHILRPPRRPWDPEGPQAWILLGASEKDRAESNSEHPILEAVRASLRRVGVGTDPSSSRSVARWERYLLEEEELLRVLRRRLRREARRRARSHQEGPILTPPARSGQTTTPLPGPRHGR
jgi:hypothetical protein